MDAWRSCHGLVLFALRGVGMIYLFVIEGLLTIAILFARWFLFFKKYNFGDFEKSAWLLLNQAVTDVIAVFTHEESGVEFRFTKRFWRWPTRSKSG